MNAEFDLDAYCERISYTGPRSASFEVLEALHFHHALAIPFENLNPLLGWPVLLDDTSLQRKLVRDGRGGYCFEQNQLFAQALKQIGFAVTGLAARVLWNHPDDAITARGHMLLLISLGDSSYIADVGFGGMTPTAPLRLETGIEQVTPHEMFRLVAIDDFFLLQAKVDGRWKSLYRFDLQQQHLVDYEIASWYLSHHPASQFVTSLIAARPDSDRRHALRDDALTTHHLNGGTERKILASVAEMRGTLKDVFHLPLDDRPEIDVALQRLLKHDTARE